MAESNLLKEAKKLKGETDRIFADFVGAIAHSSSSEMWFPELDKVAGKYENYRKPMGDLCVTPSKFILKLEMPGVEKQDVSVNAKEAGLEVVAKRKIGMEEVDEGKGVCFLERNYEGFYRFVVLPPEADSENSQASCQDGILTVVIPKKRQAVRSEKKIEVK